MAKKTARSRAKPTRSAARKSAVGPVVRLTAEQRRAINAELDHRIRRSERVEREVSLIGRKSMALLAGLLPRAEPLFRQRVRDYERVYGPLPNEASREALLRHTRDVFIEGFRLAAGGSLQSKRAASGSGAAATAARAVAAGRRIVEAYDATDPSLSDAERYAAVKRVTGVKSDSTIRKYLRSR